MGTISPVKDIRVENNIELDEFSRAADVEFDRASGIFPTMLPRDKYPSVENLRIDGTTTASIKTDHRSMFSKRKLSAQATPKNKLVVVDDSCTE